MYVLDLQNAMNSFSNLGLAVPEVHRNICHVFLVITSLTPAYALCFCVPHRFRPLLLTSL